MRLSRFVDYLREHVPIARHMDITAGEYTDKQLIIAAPLEKNYNDKDSAFAGTMASLCTLSGWAMTSMLCREAELEVDIAVIDSRIEYRKPVRQISIEAICYKPEKEFVTAFLQGLRTHGKAKLICRSAIHEGDEEAVAVVHEGTYAAKLGTPRSLAGESSYWSVDGIIDWLFAEGRYIQEPLQFTQALFRRIQASGAPVMRINLSDVTLHPLYRARSYLWRRGQNTESVRIVHGVEDSPAFVGSPLQHVYTTGQAFYKDLTKLDKDKDHSVLFEFAQEGGTDYFVLPLKYSNQWVNALSLVTDSPGGFRQSDLEKFKKLVHYLGPIAETISLRQLIQTLLNTYVGPRTGERILQGAIKRGDGEIIEAALWFSDLRGFTSLTETLSMPALLGTLNEYFEYVAAAVTARGGEILRFIGDAMLIVFPVTVSGGRKAACEAALESANDAMANLAAVNHRRRRSWQPQISFGVGLDVGEVIYGNVGAPDRLDFTVMGSTVNRSARLEGLTKEIGEPILLSEDFIHSIRTKVEYHGQFPLKGIDKELKVFSQG